MSLLSCWVERAKCLQFRGNPAVNGNRDSRTLLPQSQDLRAQRQDHQRSRLSTNDRINAESPARLRSVQEARPRNPQEEQAKGSELLEDQYRVRKDRAVY